MKKKIKKTQTLKTPSSQDTINLADRCKLSYYPIDPVLHKCMEAADEIFQDQGFDSPEEIEKYITKGVLPADLLPRSVDERAGVLGISLYHLDPTNPQRMWINIEELVKDGAKTLEITLD